MELKLSDVEINYDFDNGISIIKIDGTDFSNKTKKVETSFDAESRIPTVKLELYCDKLKISGKAKKDIYESRDKAKTNR